MRGGGGVRTCCAIVAGEGILGLKGCGRGMDDGRAEQQGVHPRGARWEGGEGRGGGAHLDVQPQGRVGEARVVSEVADAAVLSSGGEERRGQRR